MTKLYHFLKNRDQIGTKKTGGLTSHF